MAYAIVRGLQRHFPTLLVVIGIHDLVHNVREIVVSHVLNPAMDKPGPADTSYRYLFCAVPCPACMFDPVAYSWLQFASLGLAALCLACFLPSLLHFLPSFLSSFHFQSFRLALAWLGVTRLSLASLCSAWLGFPRLHPDWLHPAQLGSVWLLVFGKLSPPLLP